MNTENVNVFVYRTTVTSTDSPTRLLLSYHTAIASSRALQLQVLLPNTITLTLIYLSLLPSFLLPFISAVPKVTSSLPLAIFFVVHLSSFL